MGITNEIPSEGRDSQTIVNNSSAISEPVNDSFEVTSPLPSAFAT